MLSFLLSWSITSIYQGLMQLRLIVPLKYSLNTCKNTCLLPYFLLEKCWPKVSCHLCWAFLSSSSSRGIGAFFRPKHVRMGARKGTGGVLPRSHVLQILQFNTLIQIYPGQVWRWCWQSWSSSRPRGTCCLQSFHALELQLLALSSFFF